jgi:hypothetical protein
LPRAADGSFSAGRVHPITCVGKRKSNDNAMAIASIWRRNATEVVCGCGILRTNCETFRGAGARYCSISGRATPRPLVHVVVRVHGQHRARRRPENSVSHTAHDEAGDTATTGGGHYHHIDLAMLSEIPENLGCRLARAN